MATCTENTVAYAPRGEQINFGNVNSCMTITCTLRNGSRVAGHFSNTDQFGNPPKPALLLTAMRLAINEHEGPVDSILAKGQTRGWTEDMRPMKVLFARAKADWDAVTGANAGFLEQYSISGKEDDFKDFIRNALSCAHGVEVTIEDWPAGHLTL